MMFQRVAALAAFGVIGAAQAAFEVASVKRTPPASIGYTSISPFGSATFTATNVTLEVLIGMAFGVDSNHISGKQSWLDTESYDVSAKAEGGREISREELRPMLQNLLAERFKLSVHREMKDEPGYALIVAKGPKLQASKGGASRPMILKGGLRADNISLKMLAAILAGPAGRPVVDKTGIEGNFDVKLDYAPEGIADSSLPSIFTALQEQLGLKLVPQKVPVETLVVDRAEKVPAEN
jgi:uncharacterized protein (TIGR03435 family)